MKGTRNQSAGTHPSPGELMQAFDGELGSAELARVNAHVADCDACRTDWARLKRGSDIVAKLHQTTGPISQAALRLPPEETRASWILVLGKPWAISAAAALVCAALVYGAAWLRLWPAPHNGQELIRQTPAAPLAAMKTAVSPTHAPSHAHSRGLRGELQAARVNQPSHGRAAAAPQTAGPASQTAQSRTPQSQTAPSQTAQDVFWTLPYSNPALASQGGELIRVALPREAFVMAGVPVASIPASGPSDRISADVWLGADGLPFAIRPASYRTTSLNR
jgi:Putative zinc-finger